MERYVIRGGREGYERLKVLARAHWPDTSALFDHVGLRPGTHCLDLGCGGGEVTFEIAQLIGPDGHTTGIDMDEIKLNLAREEANARGLTNVEFRAENVNEWNEPEAYDLVYCRFLLEHLSRPLDLLRKMWAAVSPGGAIVVEDADFGGLICHPPNDGFDFWTRAYPSVLERHGGDPEVGRKLYSYFLAAGIPNPSIRLSQRADADGEAKTLPLLTMDATAAAIVAEGIASDEELNAARASLEQFTNDPGTVISAPLIFQLWSRRERIA
jgi:2-polyprenyl-3-methyl-5-hydroxy-6-metoxy-1,4-benzoquinol methylase